MRLALAALFAALACAGFAQQAPVIDGFTLSGDPTLYAPVRDVAKALNLALECKEGIWTLAKKPIVDNHRLPTGEIFIPIRDLRPRGVQVLWDPVTETATMTAGKRSVQIYRAPKRVVVDKATQMLEAYQGERLVLKTHISSGRPGHGTPNGEFVAGPVKERMHRSRLYDNSPMPWAVQINGNVFIHGYGSVPRRPASHGCIRMPLDGHNPAKWLYHWIDIGTPVTIQGVWNGTPARTVAATSEPKPAMRHTGA